MYGLVDGAYICNIKEANEISARIAARNIPSHSLEPAFSPRPVSTKYTILPIVDQRKETTVSLDNYPHYNVSQVFNPGTAQAPWSGFASQINTESSLRNQFFALQKADQARFIPSSNSSLYQTNMPYSDGTLSSKNTYKEEAFNFFNPNPHIQIVGNNIFDNNTRTQIKNINCP